MQDQSCIVALITAGILFAGLTNCLCKGRYFY
jgi:hypothetical protein